MARSSKPQTNPTGRKQPQPQIPKKNLLGPSGDPAEGRRDVESR